MTLVEFRDGEVDVPDHLAILMRGMRTWEMTYQQAIDLANQQLAHKRLLAAQQQMLKDHFKKNGTS